MSKNVREVSIPGLIQEVFTNQFESEHPMLCEMAKVYSDQKDNISIQINRSEGRNGCYFKIFNDKNYKRASKVARIDMLSPNYLYHSNGDKKKDWVLNSNEKSMLSDLLSKELPNGITLWQEIIVAFNKEGDLPEWETMKNTLDNRLYRRHLPIDLPIPDYKQLHCDVKKSKNPH